MHISLSNPHQKSTNNAILSLIDHTSEFYLLPVIVKNIISSKVGIQHIYFTKPQKFNYESFKEKAFNLHRIQSPNNYLYCWQILALLM